MRNLLLLLILANVLYFLWERVTEEGEEPGIAVVREDDLGPPLELADPSQPPETPAPAANASADADTGDIEAVDTGTPLELAAVTGRSCVSIGPFREVGEADTAEAEFEADDMRASVRTTQGELFVGHWVQIRNIEDRATAEDMLKTLSDGGLGEAYIVRTDDEGLKISLGLFGDMSGAERMELQAKSMGLPADITPRMREATVFYVDVGLPPGRGAGAMIEKYGEDRVQLRDAATCPRLD
ncbi:MAG TPA: SPOR domain-containing protein [Woeseiaceae bacterium]|nr:SPOR domain-containing protein [Woeseiaceae bacterium]